ncbi:MAG TPA: twin-arginine translocase subunit TatC [Acidiferrobacteraceae bacterium]|nr:twin-arginine translocase subunit TatC [Acidiferrobacteraceae bacterium]
MAQTTTSSETDGTFISHLLELRTRLLRALTAVFVVFVALFPFTDRIYALMARPLVAVLPHGSSMIATDLPSTFLTPMKLTLAVALALSIPYLLYQLWAFVAPGLYAHEKRMVLPLLLSSTALFYVGMAFAYFVIFPVVFQFFAKTAPPGVRVMTDIRSYLSFVFTLLFAFGIAFEVPVAVVLLSMMGIVNPETLARKRRYIVVGIFVAAAILAPPDATSMILLAVPMWLLFEVGLFFGHRVRRRTTTPEDSAPVTALALAPAEAPIPAPPESTRDRPRRRRRRRRPPSAKGAP